VEGVGRSIAVQGWPLGKNIRPYQKKISKTPQNNAGGVAQVVKSSKLEDLNSNPSTTKKKKIPVSLQLLK
jgi:hypothetical protein